MTFISHFLVILTLFLSLSVFALCEPVKDPGAVIPRSELVTELEVILSKWEIQSAKYASKADVQSLRSVLVQMREDLDSLNARQTEASERALDEEQRTDHIGRPGF